MIFVFAEDATLHLVADLDEVRRTCEPIDVESSVYQFFDEAGRPLRAEFTRPNKVRRFLGIQSVEPGEYVLVPDDDPAHDSVEVALLETELLAENPWFVDLDAVRRYLGAQGSG